jgi:hypothetical protein
MVIVSGIVIGCLLLLLMGVVVTKATRGRLNTRRVNTLYDAAVNGDHDRIQRRATTINLQDWQGNSALHWAYYRGQQSAIDVLVDFGADDNLRNSEGLSPVEMGEVAAIETLLDEGSHLLSGVGTWLDAVEGRVVYDKLKTLQPRLYNPALVRRILAGHDRRRLLFLAIKLGVRGSEQRLADVLRAMGTKAMAVDYLNAGPPVLRKEAEAWAKRNGYRIHYTGTTRSVSWARF